MFLTDRKLERRIAELKEHRYRDIINLNEFTVQEDTQGVVNPVLPEVFTGWDTLRVGDGRMRTTPAEHVGADTYWTDGDEPQYIINISGEMREAELFGENMILRRSIETTFGVPEIVIKDCITNESFREETMMLLYHFNVGYPFLNEDCEIILPTKEVIPRDDVAEKQIGLWSKMEKPADNEPECVFIHELSADKEGNTFAAVINERLGIGIKIQFNQKYLPYFMQWKSVASGDYVIGLEPANSSVLGKTYHLEKGDLHMLNPFETENIELRLSFLEGKEIKKVKEEALQLVTQYKQDKRRHKNEKIKN